MFEERLKEQDERHDGGNKWIGTGGTSPFGHSGQNPQGIRVGGSGGGRLAIQIASQRRFREYRSDLTLDVRQLSVALRRLRRLGRDGRATEVDIDGTIDATAKNAGDLDVRLHPPRENRLKVLLLMDVGGSMDPFADLCSRLFSAAHGATHFREFHAFYFHNCVYEAVWRDARMTDAMTTRELLRWLQPETRLIFVGDAFMAPYELFAQYGAIDYWHHNEQAGIGWLQKLAQHFRKAAWLNPMPEQYWHHSTISAIGDIIPMFELTRTGWTVPSRSCSRALSLSDRLPRRRRPRRPFHLTGADDHAHPLAILTLALAQPAPDPDVLTVAQGSAAACTPTPP
ncbi:MAG: VWA domain-containing protein [bacterium]